MYKRAHFKEMKILYIKIFNGAKILKLILITVIDIFYN